MLQRPVLLMLLLMSLSFSSLAQTLDTSLADTRALVSKLLAVVPLLVCSFCC